MLLILLLGMVMFILEFHVHLRRAHWWIFFWCWFLKKFFFTHSGTTCATVLTQAILVKGCKSVVAGVNVMDLHSGINMVVDAVIFDLKSRALKISKPEEISQVLDIAYPCIL